MKNKFILTTTVVLIFITVIGFYINEQKSEIRQREDLAQELELDPKDYSRDHFFPQNYFYKVIVPGMPIVQVHKIIKGYKAVFGCGESIEIYYFYSTLEEETTRFAILYDFNKDLNQKEVVTVLIEDKNSESLAFSECTQGLLKPTK